MRSRFALAAMAPPVGEADDGTSASFLVLRLTGRAIGPVRVW